MTTSEDGLFEAARERLREFGVGLKVEASPGPGLDVTATLSGAGSHMRYAVNVKQRATLGSVSGARMAAHHHPLLIISDLISRRSAAALRDAGIQFVDALGNAFIRFDGVLIDVQGRSESAAQGGRTPRPARQTNLFSPRRSQVILALLTWPELTSAKVRSIANAAGVSIGQAHDAMTQLEQAAFVTPETRRLNRADELLDHWTGAYPIGLGRRLELARYHGEPAKPISGLADQPMYLSGESADGTDITRPATLTIYLTAVDPYLAVTNRWSSSPERRPNIFVRRKFWLSPQPERTEIQNAPWPLVYADLMTNGDARLREVATVWRTHHARSDEV